MIFYDSADATATQSSLALLWSPYGIGQTIIFLPCGFLFFLLLYGRPM